MIITNRIKSQNGMNKSYFLIFPEDHTKHEGTFSNANKNNK